MYMGFRQERSRAQWNLKAEACIVSGLSHSECQATDAAEIDLPSRKYSYPTSNTLYRLKPLSKKTQAIEAVA